MTSFPGVQQSVVIFLRVLLSQQSIVNTVDCRDEDGWTALHAAVYWEHMEAAAMLVKKGASINLVTKTVSGGVVWFVVCDQISFPGRYN